MAEILADTVRHAVARLAGQTREGHRQSAAGQRPGVETAKSFYYDTDCTVYHAGIPETIPALMRASVYLSGGTTFNLKTSRWISFTIVGSGQHYITPQQNWPSVFAAVDAIGIEYHTRAGWRQYVPNSLSIVPPPPPIVIITSTDGGEDLTTGFGSNPYTLQVGWNAGTKTLTEWFTQFPASSRTDAPDGIVESEYPDYQAPSYFPSTVDWHLWNFDAHANAGDHWPLPYAYYDTVNYPSAHPDMTFAIASSWWPFWHDPVFGVTNGIHFDPTQIWDTASPFVVEQQLMQGGSGTYPDHIEERILIRGKIDLPPLPSGTTVTAIGWNSFNDFDFQTDDLTLNDGQVIMAGHVSGARPQGLFTDNMISTNHGGAGGWWWGMTNLLAMTAYAHFGITGGAYGDHHEAASWIGIVFSLDNGTHWAPPPVDWQDGGGTFTTAVEGAPIAYFGRGVTNSIDFGNIGAGSREYFRHTFTIPAGTIHDGTLALTAETGIGSIYLNGHLIDAHDETIDLYTSMTTLVYTIPAAYLIAGGSNIIAVQCYSITGPCRLMYELIVR